MKIKANAKVNLSLDITGRREDGYHTLCSVMQSVSLCDVIEVKKSDEMTVICDKSELSGSDNLCFKAAEKFFEEIARDEKVTVKINKKIPVAGGLGGGSADAAAVLFVLNKMYGEPLEFDKLSQISLSLGADVPFCLGGGTVLAKGIGEQLTRLPSLPDCFIVIAKKGVKSSTKDMYNAIDSTEALKTSDIDRILMGLTNGDLQFAAKGFYNRFCEVSESAVLSECESVMKMQDCIYCGLSGAGPSIIGIFESEIAAQNATAELVGNGFEAYCCTPTDVGVEIIE
ncbi:MAG: 4-(cytidine 5'-diphospho)-2-C-methyl-D-erythritol kinase [Ruminococcaceae bacterium]|nr:4-(cytidine 5'-diphospho)-2-C-methyl-D-erythritol kinase [Oscillospiraceae bacterium]